MREMQWTETEPGLGVTPRSLSPGWDTHIQGAPGLLAGEVVSATEQVDKVDGLRHKTTGLLLCYPPFTCSSFAHVKWIKPILQIVSKKVQKSNNNVEIPLEKKHSETALSNLVSTASSGHLVFEAVSTHFSITDLVHKQSVLCMVKSDHIQTVAHL